MNKPALNLVFSSDANFYIGLETAFATSIIASHENTEVFNIYIDGEGITSEQKNRLTSLSEELTSRYNVAIHVTWLELSSPTLDKLNALNDSRTYYTRLILPELIPEHDFVIWIDADMIIRKDLGELRNVLHDNTPLALVPDPCIRTLADEVPDPKIREKINTYNLDVHSRYHCAGFFPANLKVWRDENLTDRFLDWLAAHKDKCSYRDQSAFNWTLADRIQSLSKEHSFLTIVPSLGTKDFIKPVNLHFAGPNKPWNFTIDWNTRFFARDFRLLFACFEFYSTRVELCNRYDEELLTRFLAIAKEGHQFLSEHNKVCLHYIKAATRWAVGSKRKKKRWLELAKFYRQEAPAIFIRLDEVISLTEKYLADRPSSS